MGCEEPKGGLRIPKGFHHLAQGCEGRATLGRRDKTPSTLKGLNPLVKTFNPKHNVHQIGFHIVSKGFGIPPEMKPFDGVPPIAQYSCGLTRFAKNQSRKFRSRFAMRNPAAHRFYP